MSGPELRAPSSFFLVIVLASLISCNNDPRTNTSDEEGPLSINLRAITGSDQSQMFTEVKRASLLPTTVLHEFRDGIADRGQPFNKTDMVNLGLPLLPPAQLIAAAVSKQYCIVSYWLGGYALTFNTSIFEFSDVKAKEIWLSEGGLTVGQLEQDLDLKLRLRDLKKIVESGWRRNLISAARSVKVNSDVSDGFWIVSLHEDQAMITEIGAWQAICAATLRSHESKRFQ